MRLTKIKLAGFKSFVEPTTIPFPGEMTAVVGPNGCGKSNVIDAVRWVLGESSAKNLRGDAMTDVIFNGSSTRKALGQCSVELIFDNSQARIAGEYGKYSELAVKRLVTRDAQSTYFLNGSRCRRKDVTDIFLGTGLGPRSYAIIEQGMISRLIESKPQELRVFLEEAAGVSKYKERRRETENRIRHTQENLERLDDVRGELARQLETLQRQAAAAQRYKTLKAEERQYKAKLTAARWLKLDEKIKSVTATQRAEQRELDTLEAKYKGEEAGLIQYRQNADNLRAEMDALQQKTFTLGNEITRIEQSALHSKQRAEQIEKELSELNIHESTLNDAIQEARETLDRAHHSVTSLEPELATSEAQLMQCEESLEDAEQALDDFSQHSRQHEDEHADTKHRVQRYHSQIQSQIDMQMRNQQRISALRAEIAELKSSLHDEQVSQAESTIDALTNDIARLEQSQHIRKEQYQRLSEQSQQEAESLAALKAQRQNLSSRIAAIETLQQDTLEQTPADATPLWRDLDIPDSLHVAVESLLQFFHQPVRNDNAELLEHSLPAGHTLVTRFLSPQDMLRKDSLAARISPSQPVPALFNQVIIKPDLESALTAATTLQADEIALSEQGYLVTSQWLFAPAEQKNDGALRRQDQLNTYTEQRASLDMAIANAQGQYETLLQQVDEAQLQFEKAKSELQRLVVSRDTAKERLAMAVTHASRQQSVLDKRQAELDAALATESQDAIQLEQLSEALYESEQRLETLVRQVAEQRSTKETLEADVRSRRSMLSQYQNHRHQLELALNQQQQLVERYSEQVTRNQNQAHDYALRRRRLDTELTDLREPIDDQNDRLQSLLVKRDQLEIDMSQHRKKLSELEAIISEATRDHQSIGASITRRQHHIDNLTIEIESNKARSDAILEQMSGTGFTLKQVLAQLDGNADEKLLENHLTQTSRALSRLGAVNLAAVEEYEEQAERKTHLDTQYDDLNEALETLLSAIRKIDKETRIRFADTFHRVNEDVKALFPKVFGGGSAYLELTDDDLLETGVTIMARPPGKKNSTIHLLSGGEKALTALSLVFAIFRLNPAPFCLLDEVDAPLDDANVGRFCNLVSEMSQTVQFIYITHNKIAMEMATHLTGVTMAEPGVSRMVAVDVDEAMAFVES